MKLDFVKDLASTDTTSGGVTTYIVGYRSTKGDVVVTPTSTTTSTAVDYTSAVYRQVTHSVRKFTYSENIIMTGTGEQKTSSVDDAVSNGNSMLENCCSRLYEHLKRHSMQRFTTRVNIGAGAISRNIEDKYSQYVDV
jgi:hypothetical protein